MRMFLQNLLYICVTVMGVDAARHFLDSPEVARLVQMLEDGSTQRRIAERLGVSMNAVGRL